MTESRTSGPPASLSVCRAGVLLRAAAVVLLGLAAQAADFRAGQGKSDITPPPGMPMAGYYNVRLNEGIHDPLQAKAIVLEKDGVKAALVACDLVDLSESVVRKTREIVERTCGIPGSHTMISATHTHTGPVMSETPPGASSQASAIAREYLSRLPERIAAAVSAAANSLRPVKVRAGSGREDSISFVRRFVMKDGSIGWNPGKLNPNIVRPVSTIDPEVPVVSLESPSNGPIAAYVNFANHLDTVGGLQFSADYPYTLARLLGEAKGPEMLTLFSLGACGNVNHINVMTPEPQKGHAEAARIGTILAGSVLKVWPRLRELETGAVRARVRRVSLPVVPVTPDEVAKAREVAARFGTPAAAPFYEQVWAFKVLTAAERNGRPMEAEVQVIALGNEVAWVGLPGEVFVELGKAVKLASPFPHTIVVTLANGSLGEYIPDRKAYAQGAYEVISTPLAPGGGEALAEAAAHLLLELRDPYPPAKR